MFVDSHCHLDFPELAERQDEILTLMADNAVTHALCVSVKLETFARVLALAEAEQVEEHNVREELSALIERQPEDVATLLRGWLVER